MAIRKRAQADVAAIEAFGAAADEPVAPREPRRTAQPVAENTTVKLRDAPKATASVTTPKSLLIRWPNSELAAELAEVAALEDRSQHKTALRALQRGLEVLRAEHHG